MKQIVQSLKTGLVELVDIPCPQVGPGQVLIRSRASIISLGTERMLLDFGKASLLQKARQQPDKVRSVLQKVKTDGLASTLIAVHHKLDQPIPLGYCNAGVIIDIGPGVEGFAIGDRVASNGKHAEVVSVPARLCAKVPPAVSDEAAAFTVVSAIALQGIRLVQPTLGEGFVVIGLGLIGLLTVQLLRAHGCRVLGIDFDETKLALAQQFGANTVNAVHRENVLVAANDFSRGKGVDGVIIAASTKSNEPVRQAAQMCRKRGRIVLIGVTGLGLSRADFYEKEISFQVSCSYGPGRYDLNYEEKGHDYPVGFVRWTEQRNFEAVLDMLAEGRIDTTALSSHRFSLADFQQAYALVSSDGPSLGIVLNYPSELEKSAEEATRRVFPLHRGAPFASSLVAGFIGAGNYVRQVLAPAFRKAGVRLKTVASVSGLSGLQVGSKHGFAVMTTDIDTILADPEINIVVIATRHNDHAAQICAALTAGKHVFVEKPLALTAQQLTEIADAYETTRASGHTGLLMVGFNRRFAPQVLCMKELLDKVTEPKSFILTVNAGMIPAEHWVQDPEIGGGRVIGEACHFVDLLRFLAGVAIVEWQSMSLNATIQDTVTLQLGFADGSIGTVHYFANGSKAFPKERLEVFVAGRVLQLDNFRNLIGFGWPGFHKMNLWNQNKGQQACVYAFVNAIKHGQPSPIPLDEIIEVSRTIIEISTETGC